MYQDVSRAPKCFTCIRVCHLHQEVSRVSEYNTCIRTCDVYQDVSRVSGCVTCIRMCHVYQYVSRVPEYFTCIRMCDVYQNMSRVSGCVTCIRTCHVYQDVSLRLKFPGLERRKFALPQRFETLTDSDTQKQGSRRARYGLMRTSYKRASDNMRRRLPCSLPNDSSLN